MASDESQETQDECAVCYQKMVLPMKLTCNHTFCFLCIKGVHELDNDQARMCPMCREPLDDELFMKPRAAALITMKDPEDSPIRGRAPRVFSGLNLPPTPVTSSPASLTPGPSTPRCAPTRAAPADGDTGSSCSPRKVVKTDPVDSDVSDGATSPAAARVVQSRPEGDGGAAAQTTDSRAYWLYAAGGNNSWWRFDPRLEKDIEANFQSGRHVFDMSICGHMYSMNLDTLQQERVQGGNGGAFGTPPQARGVHGRKRELLRVDSTEGLRRLRVRGIAGVRITGR